MIMLSSSQLLRLLRSSLQLLIFLVVNVKGNAIVPEGFEETVVVGNLNRPDVTDFTFTSNRIFLLTSKAGQVYVIKDLDTYTNDPVNDNGATLALNLEELIDANTNTSIFCKNGSRGLGSITSHPNFEENGYVYLYWTYAKHGTCDTSATNGPVNRVSRFILDPETLTIDFWNTQHVIFDTIPLQNSQHNHGCLEFGPNDGNLYVTHGDGDDWSVVQSLSNLFGKVMRFTDDGSIPISNPYYDAYGEETASRCNRDGMTTSGKPCQEIFAVGVRNVFRCAMSPNEINDNVKFYLNDVGAAKWEEISVGGTDHVSANYGWPQREGPCLRGRDSGADCAPPSQYEDPIHYYPHNDDGEGAIVGGTFTPQNIGWPSVYDGGYFFVDYIFNKIYLLHDESKANNTNGCRECDMPISNKKVTEFATGIAEKPVTISFGPYGESQALYYISRDTKTVHRIAYIGDQENRIPIALISVVGNTATDGATGLQIQFDASNSYDPDDSKANGGSSDIVKYEWDLDGDGKIDSQDIMPKLAKYDKPGSYLITLTVTDTAGATDTAMIKVNVGNKPIPTIVEPKEFTTFAVGDVMILQGSAFDEEDGNLDSFTALTWEVRLHHENHDHPFLDAGTQGNHIELLPAPEPEDFYAATSSFLEILLTATDSDGLQNTVSRIIRPQMLNITFDTSISSSPSGKDDDFDDLYVMLDGSAFVTPGDAVAWVNDELPIFAPDQCTSKACFKFTSWSDEGSQLHTIQIQDKQLNNKTVTRTNPTYTALYDVFTFDPMNGMNGNVILEVGEFLRCGETKTTLVGDLKIYLKQEMDGNLILYYGSRNESSLPRSTPLWESGASYHDISSENIMETTDEANNGDCYTRILREDGVLITRGGRNEDETRPIWRSHQHENNDHSGAMTSSSNNYFLAVSYDLKMMSIFQGTPTNPTQFIWTVPLTQVAEIPTSSIDPPKSNRPSVTLETTTISPTSIALTSTPTTSPVLTLKPTKKTVTENPTISPMDVKTPKPTTSNPQLGLCQAGCTSDTDCKENLICFKVGIGIASWTTNDMPILCPATTSRSFQAFCYYQDEEENNPTLSPTTYPTAKVNTSSGQRSRPTSRYMIYIFTVSFGLVGLSYISESIFNTF